MIRIPTTTVRAAFCGLLVLASGRAVAVAAQSGGAGTGGAARLQQEERLASNWRRVLMIGAHPDDEDTELLTILARGEGMDAAYLSLTRGDGGQNLIGPELGEALGVLRTEELAAARRIDGARQFFTRAFDFGFSKREDESLLFWNRDSVLKDMVRVIRRFRPQVIVSVWSGTPADGHGHHQASGVLALEAFHAAGDPARFPELGREQLAPWQPSKYYESIRGQGGTPTLTFDGGVIDPATGLSLHQLAMRSRSQHRSQNQGNLEDIGPSRATLRLVERLPAMAGRDDSLFAGIAPQPVDSLNLHAIEARLIRAGVVLDATTDDDEVTPGQKLPVTLSTWNSGRDTVWVTFGMVAHPGFVSHGDQCPQSGALAIAPGTLFHCEYATEVEPHAFPTTPYYLMAPRLGALYRWTGDVANWGEPSEPPLQARFGVSYSAPARGGYLRGGILREVQARFKDPVLGEVRRPVMIVPAIAVDLSPSALLWPAGVRRRPFHVSLEHLARDSSDATVSLKVPKGWTTSAPQRLRFTREGERAVLTFQVSAPRQVLLDDYRISAQVRTGNDSMDVGLYRIRYPHVRDRNLPTAAQATATVANVSFPNVGMIGYVRGGGDLVPEAMINAGLAVELLTGDALERGSLARFKVIVIGPRAYEADESLRRAHPRLMQWLRGGGTLVLEYEQLPYMNGGFPPLPLTFVNVNQSRVTDETAPVTLLAPSHPVLHWPNPITKEDFSGWVQERGLDFPQSWDPAWTPILETHDSGGPALTGGLLIAKVGTGTAVYTGLAFHRQLPAIVPGAWRLWANILGAGQVASGAKR